MRIYANDKIVDDSNPLPVSVVSGGTGGGAGGGSGGTLTANVADVATAGTAVQLPNVACSEVTIIAKKDNTGSIYVGDSGVSSSVYGAELEAKDSITIRVNNANLIWIDASGNGEGISYVAV